MITRIRNAVLIKSRTVIIRKTLLTTNICRVLKEEGFIDHFESLKGNNIFGKESFIKYISISLKYKGNKQKPYISGLKRISKPGFRVYVNYKNVPKVLGGIGVSVFRVSS